jgi:hypothetical protein
MHRNDIRKSHATLFYGANAALDTRGALLWGVRTARCTGTY